MSCKPVTLTALLQQGRQRLAAAPLHDENYANEAFYLLNKLSGIRREQLVLRGGEMVEGRLAAQYLELTERRALGEPLQYLLGEWEFFGLPIKVGAGVLIPRPETEQLVERVLDFIKPIPSPTLLDLCSGSGCIPIAIAHSRPDAETWGVELSREAYKYFTENIAINAVKNVTTIMSDVFCLPADVTDRRYNVVTSNPPYIAGAQLDTLQAEVRREPAMALDGGSDGLDFYRRLPQIAAPLLHSGGLLALEIGEEQGGQVAALMTEAGFATVTIHKDISGNDRIVTGTK